MRQRYQLTIQFSHFRVKSLKDQERREGKHSRKILFHSFDFRCHFAYGWLDSPGTRWSTPRVLIRPGWHCEMSVIPIIRIDVSSSSFITTPQSQSNTNVVSWKRKKKRLTFNQLLYTLLSIIERIQEWSTHSNSGCTETQSLKNVRTSSNSAIDVYFNMVKDLWEPFLKLQQGQNGRRRASRPLSILFTRINLSMWM